MPDRQLLLIYKVVWLLTLVKIHKKPIELSSVLVPARVLVNDMFEFFSDRNHVNSIDK